uniref:ELYS-like domain-containing protein n=1 Tax=Mycena chlorophos TaxID=658473 RepID=A0ABQ0M3E0_MYCCL|nr:predicted protein [Mycena chlorophos]
MSAEPSRDSVGAILAYFDLTTGGFPWTEAQCQQIHQRRALLSDVLLFDILLRSGNIDDALYPPVDVEGFHRLLEKITLSSYDQLKQDCLVYFLLKWYRDGRDERFKTERCIPPHFASLSDAYWNLDVGFNVPQAVSILADARLNTDYASKILQAISLAENSMPLVLKYVRTAKPLLIEPDDIDLYTVALAESGLSEAWRFQRTFSEQNPTRQRILKKVLDWSLSPPRRNALQQLLGISFSPYEQDIVERHATPPSTTLSPTGIATLQNLLCVRLIQTGRFVEAIKLDKRFAGASSTNLPLQADRTKMVQEIYAALPLAERTMLDVEMESPPARSALTTVPSTRDVNMDMDTSMSWQDISVRDSMFQAAPATPHKQPLLASMNAKVTPAPPFFGFGTVHKPAALSAFPSLSSSASMQVAPSTSFNSAQNAFSASTSSRPVVPQVSITTTNPPQNVFSSLTQSTKKPLGSPNQIRPNSPPKGLFESANRRQNAFYRPPAAAPVLASVFPVTASAPIPDHVDVEMTDESVTKAAAPELQSAENDEEEADESLAYSVFSTTKPLARVAKQPPPTTANKRSRQSKAAKATKQRPPGAFGSDDELEAEDATVPPPTAAPPPARTTRRSAAASRAASATAAPLPKATRSKRTTKVLPGSLVASEDEDDDGSEAEEEVAPLPPPTSKRASAMQSAEAGECECCGQIAGESVFGAWGSEEANVGRFRA